MLYGPACVRLNNDRPCVEMTVEKATRPLTSDFDVLELTYSARPQASGARVVGIGGHQNRVRVRVQSAAGEFRSGPDWDYQFAPIAAGQPIRLQLTPMKAAFSASTPAEEQFMILPLTHFRAELPHDRSVIEGHPLCSDPENSSRFVAFTIEGRVGFIQEFQGVGPARSDDNAGITAVAVIPLTDHSMIDPWGWFLNIFLRLLSFAIGCDVVCRWIETRDSEGRLVQRIHLPIGDERAPARGHAAISKAVHWRDGSFLTAALAAPEVREPFFSIALRHCIRAAQAGMTLDDELSHLMRGFESLCLRFETNKQDLLKSLDSNLKGQITAVLAQAAGQIRSLAGIPAADRTIVSRLAERTRSAAQADRSFGLSVQMLVEKLGLRDHEVLAPFYQAHPGPGDRDWVQTLAYFRGALSRRIP